MSQRYEAYVILSRGHPPKCAECGDQTLDHLEIDHMARDGKQDRAAGMRGEKLYRWIVKHPEPARAKYRVLCSNHNLALERRHYRGERVYEAPSGYTWALVPSELFEAYYYRVSDQLSAKLAHDMKHPGTPLPGEFDEAWEACGLLDDEYYDAVRVYFNARCDMGVGWSRALKRLQARVSMESRLLPPLDMIVTAWLQRAEDNKSKEPR